VSPSSPRSPRRVRRGFTLVELMIVISVILILAGMILTIRPTSPEGLANGQRMLASSLRSARAQAMANRAAIPRPAGLTLNWAPADFRYRVLIKNDPTDPDRHLREVVLAIGVRGLGAAAAAAKYTWFSPDPSIMLPPGVYFVPPVANAVPATGFTNPAVIMPTGTNLSGTSSTTRLSRISALADPTGITDGTYDRPNPTGSQAPMMLYRPIFAPNISTTIVNFDNTVHTAAQGGKQWFYVEFGADGTSNHAGRVVLVVAEGVNTGGQVLLTSPDKFAAIVLRRSGDLSLTTDTTEFELTSVK
jgi:prepilin-type N-terminal cleavage/methylation domain-containing protein